MVDRVDFSAGNFQKCRALVQSIRDALRDTGGSEDDFQLIYSELGHVDHMLRALDDFRPEYLDQNYAEAVRLMGWDSRRPLEDFLNTVQKIHKPALGVSVAGTTADAEEQKEVQWSMFMKKEVQGFRGILNMKTIVFAVLFDFLISWHQNLSHDGEDHGKTKVSPTEPEYEVLVEAFENAEKEFKKASAAADESARVFGKDWLSFSGTPKSLLQMLRQYSIGSSEETTTIPTTITTVRTDDVANDGSARSTAKDLAQELKAQRDGIRDWLLRDHGEMSQSMKADAEEQMGLTDLLYVKNTEKALWTRMLTYSSVIRM